MTKYLKEYIAYIEDRIKSCNDSDELKLLMSEHRDKIVFMQHERLIHFLVTMMFTLILVALIAVLLFLENVMLFILIVLILCLLGAYIKHYYFLENTVQHMYKIYDSILEKSKNIKNDGEK